MTGQEYIESLRDGREIYLYGERVKDVTSHPAFRNPARMIARLYDALHDPERSAVLVAPTDTGGDGYTHPFLHHAAQRRGPYRGPESHRGVGSDVLRLDGTQPRL